MINKIKIVFGKKRRAKRMKKDGISLGKNSSVDNNSEIGSYTYIGDNCNITRAIIGRYCSIGNNVSIGQGEHNILRISSSTCIYSNRWNMYEELTKKDCIIGNDVWIGVDSIIRRGVCIGDGAVVGANSFVNNDVPPYAVVAGSPAKVIKFRFDSNTIEKIKESRWWCLNLNEARDMVLKLEKELF